MSEYEEITVNFNAKQFQFELDYQINNLGYSVGDPFPQFLIDEAARRFNSNRSILWCWRQQSGSKKCSKEVWW